LPLPFVVALSFEHETPFTILLFAAWAGVAINPEARKRTIDAETTNLRIKTSVGMGKE
jgi:hypothetical protein